VFVNSNCIIIYAYAAAFKKPDLLLNVFVSVLTYYVDSYNLQWDLLYENNFVIVSDVKLCKTLLIKVHHLLFVIN